MRSSSLIRLAAAAAFVVGTNAQDASGTEDSSPTATSSAAATHTVSVGAEGFTYSPASLDKIPKGDFIEFRFYPGGHTVVRAEFGYPCIPYEYTGPGKVGFYSGVKAPQVISNNLPTFQIEVEDDSPIFYYCSAPTSCVEHHMIGVINPNPKTNQTLKRQLEIAQNVTFQLAPGDPFPTETASANPSSSGGDHHLSGGAIAGIVIGGAAVLVLAGGLIYLCGWKYGKGTARPTSTQTLPQMSATGMGDGKFSPGPNGPLSPPAESSAHFSLNPGNDPYRGHSPAHSHSPSQHYAQSPALTNRSSHPAYGHYSQLSNQNVLSPASEMDSATGLGFYHEDPRLAPHEQANEHTSPVELPTSSNPGNSPLPQYQERKYSWSQGSEAYYRPGGKP